MRSAFSEHTTQRLAGYLLLLMTLIVYLPSIGGDFIWDDESYIRTNPLLTTSEGLYHIWFNLRASPQYYPLTFTTFWIEFQLWKLWPGGYHLINILLHGANAILLWRLLSRLAIPGAWLAAAVFALHPVQVDSVAQISERKNVLSMVFYLAALLTYLRFSSFDQPTRDHAPRSWSLYGVVIFLFVCALLSKTTACSLPAVIGLLVWWKRDQIQWKQDLLPLLPLFAIGLAMSKLTVFVEQEVTGATGILWNHSWLERILIAGRAFWLYVSKLFWPVDLMFMYPKWEIDPSAPWPYLFPAFALVTLILIFVLHKRIGKAPSVALFYFTGNLLPALGFVNLYYMRYSFAADHFQYLASIGLITFSVAVLWQKHGALYAQIRQGNSHPFSLLGAFFRAAPYRTLFSCGVLLSLGVLSWNQEYIYTNGEIVWTETLKKDPTNVAAHNNLGGILLEHKENERAITHFQAAIDLEPEYPEPHYNMAIAHSRLGRFDEAIFHGQLAVKLKSNSASFHSVLASALWEKGDTALAIEHFRTATQLSPTIPAAHHNLGLLYLLEPPTLTNVQPQEAITQLEKALALNPDLLQTQYTLAWVLATFPNGTVRDGKKAIYIAEQACQRTRYLNLQLLDTLAAAYAENGQFSQAVQTAQTAADLALARQQGPLARQITARLDLYKVGKPYRDSLEQLRNLKATS